MTPQSQKINSAIRLMAECRKTPRLLAEVDSALRQLLQLNYQDVKQAKQKGEIMKLIASAFGLRFLYTNGTSDLEEMLDLLYDFDELPQEAALIAPEDTMSEHELDSKTKNAATTLASVGKLSFIQTLEKVISILQLPLNNMTKQTVHRQMAILTTIAEALSFRFHHHSQVNDLNDAISHLGHAIKLEVPEKGWLYSYAAHYLCNLLSIRFLTIGRREDLEKAMEYFINMHSPEEPETPEEKVTYLLRAAGDFQEQFLKGKNIQDLLSAIELYRQGIADIPIQNEKYFAASYNLARALQTQFQKTSLRSHLLESISLLREAVELCPDSYHNRAAILSHLASDLFTSFEKADGYQKDLDDAILLHRQVLDLRLPPDSDRASTLIDLSTVLYTRYIQNSQLRDLEEAICLLREVMELQPISRPEQINYLMNLGAALLIRYERFGNEEDTHEALSLNRQLFDLVEPSHPARPKCLSCLASALTASSEHSGSQVADLNEAISLYKEALTLQSADDPERLDVLNNYGSSLLTLYEIIHSPNDLDDAICLLEEALAHHTATISRNRSGFLLNLASALWTRFLEGKRQGNDLERSVSLSKEALSLQTTSHVYRSAVLTTLGNALWAQYSQEGQPDNLQQCISIHRQALELRDKSHPHRGNSLNSLASVLLERFSRGGQKGDLEEAIALHGEAIDLRPTRHPERLQSLTNLALALLARYGASDRKGDLVRSIDLLSEVLTVQDIHHPKRYIALTNLARALLNLFNVDGSQSDLDRAINLHREALESQKEKQLGLFHNLAVALSTRFECVGHDDDFSEALALYEKVIDLYPQAHPNLVLSLEGLGKLLCHAHLVAASRKSEHLDRAMSIFSSSWQNIQFPVYSRFLLARTWASYADTSQHSTAFEAYDAVLEVIPQLAAFNLDMNSRREVLSAGSDGLARKAAHYAIKFGRLDKAIEYLEAGRAVFWSQALQLRSPFEELCVVAEELGQRLKIVASELDHSSHRSTVVDTLDNKAKMSLEEEAVRLEQLSRQWLEGLDEVRNIPRFENFLKPLRVSSLQGAIRNHPVAFLVPSDKASDCIVMSSTTIHHIPLSSKLCNSALSKLVKMTQSAASSPTVARSLVEEGESLQFDDLGHDRLGAKRRGVNTVPSDDVFKHVLGILWSEVVSLVIEYIGRQNSEMHTRLIWCPTGLFSFLPVHAAGCYEKEGQKCVGDVVISSYTPTVGLLSRSGPEAKAKQDFKMLAVVDTRRLFSARAELQKIEARIPTDFLTRLGVPGAPALADQVLFELRNTSIAHFACHGKQDRLNPLDSALLVDDGELPLSRVIQEPLSNGLLAFLCACETAMGDETLPDEAMSLGASILFTGFRKVVATMWKIADEDGPTVADAFYEELYRSPDGNVAQLPNVSNSALALHEAVKTLRSKGVPFRRWVPFIHLGM